MNIKTRLAKLEEDHATKVLQAPRVSDEETRKWLDDVIQSINDGTHISEPWIITPIPPNAGQSKAFLHNLLNELARQQ